MPIWIYPSAHTRGEKESDVMGKERRRKKRRRRRKIVKVWINEQSALNSWDSFFTRASGKVLDDGPSVAKYINRVVVVLRLCVGRRSRNFISGLNTVYAREIFILITISLRAMNKINDFFDSSLIIVGIFISQWNFSYPGQQSVHK